MSNRPLHIAMVAPPWFDLPPRGYGGIEAMCADLVDALIARGHRVTLIAAGRNGTRARMVRTYDVPQGPRLGEPLPEVLHAAAAGRILADLDVDVVHDHSLAGPLLARGRGVPTVVTVHGPVDGEPGDYYRNLGDSVHLVAISEAQRRPAPDLNWCGTVHNALRPEDFPFRPDKEDWVLFLGRCTPDKGMHLAIDAARAAGREIRLAAKCSEPAEHAYFEAEIKPRLGPGVEWLGEVGGERKKELLARARCLLFPLQWEEPFGMVMIEAMACGTPVVTLRRGSVPEVVTDGATGLVRDDPAELPQALEAVGDLDPALCRKSVEERFRPEIMAAGYEAVYRRAIAAGAGVRAAVPAEPGGPLASAVDADMLPVA
ncbi:MAG TPA: glycosyltransferase family 4 protein [Streptomyces sp.]|uniref:glycosyltransferase family 4 protein n=1 Tax=Streptomyces sp. TaxID=1931 RepID=UPI002D574545|nr:glycosyltransferase family 4 protein [Streptomyces sp.]HZG02296.1 glycosyltransferase family 4 protein [Streptomyces sp.]